MVGATAAGNVRWSPSSSVPIARGEAEIPVLNQRREFWPKAPKAEIVEQRQRHLQIDVVHAAACPIDRQRDLRVEPHQIAAQEGLIAELYQIFLAFRPRHVGGMIENGFQRAVLLQQLPGELRSNQRYARHVIDGIAHQRLEIDDLLR